MLKKIFIALNIIMSITFISCGSDSSKRPTPTPTPTSTSNQTSNKVKKTGQIKSYSQNGIEVLDGNLKDDGFYKKGAYSNYTRDHANETVTDHLTGLMWQDDSAVASVRKPWVTKTNYDIGDYSNTTGDTANTYCAELVIGGFEDWRLPTREELGGITDYGRYDPAINVAFENTSYFYYWCSNSYYNYDEGAWVINFNIGNQSSITKDTYLYVRCVRTKV